MAVCKNWVVLAGLMSLLVLPVKADFINGLGMKFVTVPAGTFQMKMGCGLWQADCDNNENLGRTVTVKAFEMAVHEVTQAQWKKVVGNAPSHFGACGEDCPVENVSWQDIQGFLDEISLRGVDENYRLPTEAEWEYACRSGGKAETYCGGNDMTRLGWTADNSEAKTHLVGKQKPNGLGIYDLSGNVWEWTCSAWQNPHQGAESLCASAGSEVKWLVLRGGSWNYGANRARAATRNYYAPTVRLNNLGFRLVRTPLERTP